MMSTAFKFDHHSFNNLPEIEDSHTKIVKGGFLDHALNTTGTLFIRHGLYENWGISLLHKHWEVCNGEVPVQRVVVSDKGVEYVTRPEMLFSGDKLSPNTIKVESPRRTILIEYSEDPDVIMANNILAGSPDFIIEFCVLISENGFNDIFALSTIKPQSLGKEFVEMNYIGRISIVMERNAKDLNRNSLIETTWRFKPKEATLGCERLCQRRCVDSGNGHRFQDHLAMHRPT
ncbi:hypothetical protein JJL56_32505 [Azospirillum sp. YIM DDC1]|uniref:Uncharacterized protein n=1 Tax=Azospirillum aestuarii TaxID=2802052 RepID=A0ABS1I929_9PROT|nr:hypothetical protein [Azospirillum aestuarii]MBK4723564.1 hypothetical protein [Azospirillum aestuarii]